ncbi:hypothetical protein [Kitasatospora sp. LaBMicrA B282]|uniref:hypothetical protein n=1 Tax=Kitasatospora sp. LaBMicrA B282 TaxID=3420949 RepID=UPI003D152B27
MDMDFEDDPDFEDDLTRMLQRSVDELDPPVAVLVAEGDREGRRRRRVRRQLQAAGAALTVAAVVAGGVLVSGLGRGGEHLTVAAATGGAARGTVSGTPAASAAGTPSGAATPSSAASPSGAATPSGAAAPGAGAAVPVAADRDITWQAMVKTLADQLPPGAKFSAVNPFGIVFNTNATSRYAEFRYDDGAGASTVMLSMSVAANPQQMRNCADWHGGSDEGPRRPGYEQPSCQVTPLPDGSTMLSLVTGTDGYGLYDEEVTLFRADGLTLQITAANAVLSDSGTSVPPVTVTRDRPPVGLPGWQAIAQSPQWQFKVPQSVLDAGAAFAKDIPRLPCPSGYDPAKYCDIG